MNENPNQTSSNPVVSAIKFIAGLSFVIGIVSIIYGFNSDYESWVFYCIGIACIMDCPIIWGFAYIVEASCKYLERTKPQQVAKPTSEQIPTNSDEYELGEYDHRLDNVKVGDKVRRVYDGKILEVVSIGKKSLECRGGMLDGIHSYPKDALSIV